MAEEVYVFPVSFAQQRLWFLDQLAPNTPFYNMAGAIRIRAPLHVAVLEQSLNEVVRRHESLRTTFMADNGQPMQVISPNFQLVVPLVDLKGQSEAEAMRLVSELAQRPFDLTSGPLIRAKLLQLGDSDYILSLTLHHIISDGWSMSVLFRELTQFYRAFAQGQAAALAELPVQYADYAVWQRKYLQGDVLSAELSYWKQQLADIPTLQLPTDRPRPAVASLRGARLPLIIPTDIHHRLQALCKQQGITLFMALLAVFQMLLQRYTGQDDIVVGTPVAGRNRSELKDIIGFFVNTLVIRSDLSGNPTFLELLQRVHEVALSAYAHQDLPFEKLVEALNPQRDLSRNPLFQVTFQLLQLGSAGDASQPTQPATIQSLDVDCGTASFDLSFDLWEQANELGGRIEYNTDLFSQTAIERMVANYLLLLDRLSLAPTKRLSEFNLLTDAQQQQLTVWNDTAHPEFPQSCVHQLFEQQVLRSPDALAVLHNHQSLTYAELHRCSNQGAHYLRKLGVGPEVLVGLCLEHSPELVIGLLAILKAGGAFVPLDPACPADRLHYIMQDAKVTIVVTQQKFFEQFAGHGLTLVCLDSHWHNIAEQSNVTPSHNVTQDSLAYVIYTSGSTGTPKGCLIPHRALANHNLAVADHYCLQAHDRVLQFASIGFDVALEEIFPSLLRGAALVFLCAKQTAAFAPFMEAVTKLDLSVLNLPVIFWQAWTDYLTKTATRLPAALRLLIVGSDSVSSDALIRWQRIVPKDTRLCNSYGVSEATITTTIYDVPDDWQALHLTSVPIGQPIANTQVYLLDSYRQPLPVGVAGELYIAGLGLARAYLGREALTRERFIRHSFAGQPAIDLYQTGDRGRYLADGNIEYLGRTDDQVNIRGFRIELSEVEAVLCEYSAVAQAVVSVRTDGPSEKQLVAYLVLAVTDEVFSISALRQFLKSKLPAYMLPVLFVVLDALPLTASGKVDRQALPSPALGREHMESAYAAPSTSQEKILADIWGQILGIERVGVHDNFFELGGDSILSIQIIARANQAGVQLSPMQIFQNQTIAELAATAGTGKMLHAEQGLLQGQVELTPIQHWFFEQKLSNVNHYNQALLLQFNDAIDVAILEKAMQQVVAHHDALHLRFVHDAQGWQQTYGEHHETLKFSIEDLSSLPETEQQTVQARQTAQFQASLNLTSGPLVRGAVFLHGDNVAQLLIIIHHLVIDGVSWRIFLQDLRTVYQQLSNGQSVALAAKTTSFQYWAAQLNQYATSPLLTKQLDDYLSGPWHNVQPLPEDKPNGENSVASEATVSVSLSQSQTQALLKQVPKVYRTQINDVLLTALVLALSDWSAGSVQLVDLEGHGREPLFDDVDLSRTLGWFTSIYPVLLALPESLQLSTALKSTKEQLRILPNHGIGYGVMRYLHNNSGMSQSLSALPQAQVCFNYLGQFSDMHSEQALFGSAVAGHGSLRDASQRRAYLLEINAYVAKGQLVVDWSFSQNIHESPTIQRVAECYQAKLQALIEHCLSAQAGGFTPSDFPLAGLNQQQLDKLMQKISKTKGG